MPKRFCVTGTCIPEKNYMIDISGRIDQIIRDYIEKGQYFTINRARQYGKTTTLYLLERRLREEYIVLTLASRLQMSILNPWEVWQKDWLWISANV